jgi:uncharacterized protein
MKIGVLSDTHGDAQTAERAVSLLQRLHVDLAIHCGDVGADVVPLFNDLLTHFVYGNMDEPERLRTEIVDPKLHFCMGTT